MRVIVIGAGAIGASVAHWLALGGADVLVLEANQPGTGTSSTSLAWANSHDKALPPYHALNVAGMRAHAALAAEHAGQDWWHGTGCIEWAAPARQAEQRAKVARLQATDYAAEWIDAKQVAVLEPDIDRAALGDAPIAFFREEGWIALVPYVAAMLRIARGRGAVVRSGARVVGLRRAADRITGVTLADGEALDADVVVNCAGRWADLLEPLPGVSLPLAPTCGFMLLTRPVATTLARVIRSPDCNMRPDGGGRLMLRRAELDLKVTPSTEPRTDTADALALMRHATAVLPLIGGGQAEAARIGVRPIPRDGLPAVGPWSGLSGYYVVVTHSGATLAAILGRLAASEILGGQDASELASFRPGRLIARVA